MTCSVGTLDIIVKDKDGNVVSDSKVERIEKKRSFSELVEKYSSSNPLVKSFLKSYKSAVYDPENELVHLYEVREAITKSFGGEEKVRESLGISKSAWSSFGMLTNTASLKQGCHRGKNYESLREATHDELQECRSFARSLIDKYFDYAEANSN